MDLFEEIKKKINIPADEILESSINAEMLTKFINLVIDELSVKWRCRNCKYHETTRLNIDNCRKKAWLVQDDFFCADFEEDK